MSAYIQWTPDTWLPPNRVELVILWGNSLRELESLIIIFGSHISVQHVLHLCTVHAHTHEHGHVHSCWYTTMHTYSHKKSCHAGGRTRWWKQTRMCRRWGGQEGRGGRRNRSFKKSLKQIHKVYGQHLLGIMKILIIKVWRFQIIFRESCLLRKKDRKCKQSCSTQCWLLLFLWHWRFALRVLIKFVANIFSRPLVFFFVLLSIGWGKSGTRTPVALDFFPELYVFTMSLALPFPPSLGVWDFHSFFLWGHSMV